MDRFEWYEQISIGIAMLGCGSMIWYLISTSNRIDWWLVVFSIAVVHTIYIAFIYAGMINSITSAMALRNILDAEKGKKDE